MNKHIVHIAVLFSQMSVCCPERCFALVFLPVMLRLSYGKRTILHYMELCCCFTLHNVKEPGSLTQHIFKVHISNILLFQTFYYLYYMYIVYHLYIFIIVMGLCSLKP